MALFTVDSQNVFGKSVAEAGSYNVKILSDSEYKRTKNSGSDMAVLNYEVDDGEYRGGKILYDNIVWSNDDIEMSKKRFNTLLAAIGVPDGTQIESIQQLVQALKGKRLNIVVDWVQSTYNNKWNLNVKAHRKLDAEGSKPNGVKRPDEQQAGAKTVPFNAQQSTPQVNQLNPSGPFGNNGESITINDDDLPF